MSTMLRRIILLVLGLVGLFFAEAFLMFMGYFEFMGDSTPLDIRLIVLAILLAFIAFTVAASWKNNLSDIGRIAVWAMPVLAGSVVVVAFLQPWVCELSRDWGGNQVFGQDCALNGILFDIVGLELASFVLMLGIRQEKRWIGEWLVLVASVLITAVGFILAVLSEEPPMNMG